MVNITKTPPNKTHNSTESRIAEPGRTPNAPRLPRSVSGERGGVSGVRQPACQVRFISIKTMRRRLYEAVELFSNRLQIIQKIREHGNFK